MSDWSKDYEFIAESRSAISTYQAIRGMSADQWPPSTSSGSVVQYDGTLRAQRRLVVDLEIGDSAGEHWLGLVSSGEQEQDYLQWVLSAHAICHVVPIDSLLEHDGEQGLAQDVDDLKLAARLMQSVTRDKTRALCPVLVVISKVDIVEKDCPPSELMRIYSPASISRSYFGQRLDPGTIFLLKRFGTDLERTFATVHFLFSSVDLVRRVDRLGSEVYTDPLQWIETSARYKRRRALSPLFDLISQRR
jgi:hypothetical protein